MTKPKGFVHLHNHSEYSPDGAGTIEGMVARAAEINAPALALTDHGTLAGAVTFWAACKEHNIVPILGIEGYILWNGKRHHITMNSLSKDGFNNLINISNLAHRRYTSGYPLMVMEDFEKYSKDIVVLTGCPAGAIHAGTYKDGLEYVANLATIFGKSNVFPEVMFVMNQDFITRPFRIARDLGLKVVITNDSHFHHRHQAKSHKIITSCRKGYNYESAELWMKSWDEMEKTGLEYFHPSYVSDWMGTALSIGEMVTPWSMYAKPQLPVTVGADLILTAKLKEAFEKDVEGRSEGKAAARKNRLNYEFKMLKKMGFIDYIYILYDIIGWAHEHKIRVGPGRGSAAGSYVLYLLGITNVDPVKYDLMFERFINPARVSFPDVDVDFESARRHEVIEYAANKWGAVAVATYTHYSHKTAVHDLGRVLSVPKYLSDEAAEQGPDSEAFAKMLEIDPNIKITYDTMLEQVKNRGKHAGGIIITAVPVPIENNGKEMLAAWTEGKKKQITKAGIVKFDFLGLTALSQIQEMEELSGVKACLPSQDKAPYKIFRQGDVNGIFQWTGSDGIRRLTMEIKPTNIDDLATINSLYRPGALDAGTAKDYPKYKASPRKIHPDIDPILASTSGVIVFQEQVMRIFAKMVGGDQVDLEKARSTIIKARRWDPTWFEEMEALKAEFIERASAVPGKDYDRKLLEHVWSELETHGRYSFNASHSYAYAFVAYEMAWFKWYHPEVFYTAVLRHDASIAQTFLIEAAYKGIKIEPPHINFSTNQYELRDGKIYLPLTSISHLGLTGSEQIVAERIKNGQFSSFEDFNARTPKKACTSRSRKLLYEIGGFDGLEGNPMHAITGLADMKMLHPRRAQFEALGFVIPDKEMADFILAPTKDAQLMGFIQSWKDKDSKYGEYRVFKLSPRGSFWMRHAEGALDVEKGAFVKVKKTKNGKAKTLEEMKL